MSDVTHETAEAIWLTEETPNEVETLMRQRGWLDPSAVVTGVERAGQGNMNVTLRVFVTVPAGQDADAEGGAGSVILKQSRPWVAKYPSIPAPVERVAVERRWYEAVAQVAPVVEMMPRLLGAGQSSHTLLLQDLGQASEMWSVYADGQLEDAVVDELADYLRCLHDATADKVGSAFANRAMRELNHAHIFAVPMQADNGIELEQFEEGLTDAVAGLRNDETFMSYLEDTGEEYLQDGDVLLHGDFFPGSWLNAAGGVKVIDPEFGFAGPREFDLAVAVAHLVMAGRPDLARRFLESYGYDGFDDTMMLASFAAAEVVRRLVGVAQLPLPDKPAGWRAGLLQASREVLVNGELEPLLAAV